MGHTRPDWSTYGKLETVFALFDLGELAARLGSIDTFERGGNVIFLDDFEGGKGKWESGSFGDGSGTVLTAETARSGAYAVKLYCGAGIGRYARLTRYLPYPVIGKMGIEVSFAIPDVPAAFYLTLNLYNGTIVSRAMLQYKPSDESLSYRDSLGFFHIIASGLNLLRDLHSFHTLKLVADYKDVKYTRVILDQATYNLSSYALSSTADTTRAQLQAQLHAYSETAGASQVYIDDVIITQNEE